MASIKVEIVSEVNEDALFKLKRWGWRHKIKPDAIDELELILKDVIKPSFRNED